MPLKKNPVKIIMRKMRLETGVSETQMPHPSSNGIGQICHMRDIYHNLVDMLWTISILSFDL